MCGIVGYIGESPSAAQVLLGGLRRLEYRGYDSSGVAIARDGGVELRRALGKLAQLEALLAAAPVVGHAGIGHTRWATHGRPSVENAHPHRSGPIYVAHNGIIENYPELRDEIEHAGHKLESQTDTEVIAHLIDLELGDGDDLLAAVRRACKRLHGSYAIAVLSGRHPDRIVAAKNGGSPLILGGDASNRYLASDIPALLPHTRTVVALEDGEFAVLTRDGHMLYSARGDKIERAPSQVQWDPVSAEKGGYDRFMQKEIFEQPRSISHTLAGRIADGMRSVDLDGIMFSRADVEKVRRIYLVGCGTAHYACQVGKLYIEQLARVPAEAELASEFRYRDPLLDRESWVVAVSQSGETADTLAALRLGRHRGSRALSICNVRGASIARDSDDVLYTHAGPEIGVASTKAFTAQLVALQLLALRMGAAAGRLDADSLEQALAALAALPRQIERTLALDGQIAEIAQKYYRARDFLFLGRGILHPIALEGALKLKEISYIHAEGYAAGELKHGPIALVDESVPSVVLAPRTSVYDKVVSNLEQVRAREGKIIVIASEGDSEIASKADETLYIPHTSEHLVAILATIPLQLLAYHIAVLKGTDVDQPRNLAKSVTVE
jgi:glutamine---fructose-6-phosphate transaminase (isomerizing)